MKSSVIIGGVGSHERHPSDFYETPCDATLTLMRQLQIKEDVKIWEPACGNGAIALVLEVHGYTVVSTDIRSTINGDFLAQSKAPSGVNWIITNPPFNLAEDFIRKSWGFGIPFAFLLKATFWNTKKSGNLFKQCPPTGVYPLTWRPAMAPDRGSSPTMDFTWFVWRHKTCFRPLFRDTKT